MDRMEYANVEIRLAGSLHNTVIKEVSAPEIAVLRKIHGEDAVNKVVKTRTEEVLNKSERTRLEVAYGKDTVTAAFGAEFNQLPKVLSEVGAEVEEAPVVAAKPKKG